MSLIKWNPFRREIVRRSIFDLPYEMENIFHRFWESDPFIKTLNSNTPAIDLYDDGQNIVVKMELPGLAKKDIKISLEDGYLKVEGEVKQDKETKERDYYYSERSYGTIARTVLLPCKVIQDKADASYQDGILTITLPKQEETKRKAIKIKVN
jgi:HSP20 family protein